LRSRDNAIPALNALLGLAVAADRIGEHPGFRRVLWVAASGFDPPDDYLW